MADNKAETGCRNDLHIDRSRCLRMRFSESSCSRCAEICRHGAIKLDSGLAIDPGLCRGCLLCTAVCPVGALEHQSDFTEVILQLTKVPVPILGCIRTDDCAHATLACLGGLSAEHLLALCHSLPGKLTLNLSYCRDCTNGFILPELEQRRVTISAEGLGDGSSRIVLAESGEDIHYRDETVDRRSFFKSFGTALFKNAVGILSSTSPQQEQRGEYSVKRTTARRTLLNKTRSNLPPAAVALLGKLFDANISFDESCTKCHCCVAICPAGALQSANPDALPVWDSLLCTGCGLCAEFCQDGAVRVSATADRA